MSKTKNYAWKKIDCVKSFYNVQDWLGRYYAIRLLGIGWVVSMTLLIDNIFSLI